ncbi:hypothetical protein N8D56_21570 [Devosia sp. A8/3-2]|nr:hypothetical protein N8D56_21570 [Devosia sp. A8/3-2]
MEENAWCFLLYPTLQAIPLAWSFRSVPCRRSLILVSDARLAELPADQRAIIGNAANALGPLLESAPYLLDLAQTNAEWLAGALSDTADGAFADVIAMVETAGREAADENALSPILRIAKGRTALLAAVAETGGVWTTAQATAALSDLADAALDAALDFLMRRASAKGLLAIPPEQANAAQSGLAIFALGKHGGQELNYSSDIDIVVFYDPEKGVLANPAEATKVYSRMIQKLVGLMEERARMAMCSAPICACAQIRARRRSLSRSMRLWPITKAAARIGNAPLGSRPAPAPATSRWAKPSSRNWRPMSGASTGFRHHCRYPSHETPDQYRQECRRYPCRGAQRQARARWYS